MTPTPTGNVFSGTVKLVDRTGVVVDSSNIPVYIKKRTLPFSVSQVKAGLRSIVLSQPARVTYTDASGNYSFSNLDEGDYEITFGRTDLLFEFPGLSVSTGQVPDTIAANTKDLTHAGCKQKNFTSAITSAETKTQQYLDAAVQEAIRIEALADANLSGDAENQLKSLAQSTVTTLNTALSRALDESVQLPSVTLTCKKQPTCLKTSYSGNTSRYNAQLSAIDAAINNLIKSAGTVLAKEVFNSKSSSKNMKKLKKAASSAAKKFPKNSAGCAT